MISTLRVLNLSNNNLSSTIPDTFGYLTYLEELRINKNGITGTIPTAVMENLDQLWILHLAFNSLTGPIPNEISGLTSVETILLSSNQLTGVVPTQLANMLILRTFKSFNNGLVGPVPEEICESRSVLENNSWLSFQVGLPCSCCSGDGTTRRRLRL